MLKKTLVILVSVILTLSLFSGCGNTSTTGTSTTKPADTQATTQAATQATTQASTPAPTSSADQILATGPHGEKATPATTLSLTDAEIQKVKSGNYTAAIVLHYAGNDWSTAQAKGLQDTFGKLGIKVVAVTDANFKAEKQVSDIENVLTLKPTIIVSIPVDPVSTADAYKKAAQQGVKLVFMDNTPNNLQFGKDYVSVVSADNYGNGVASAEIMGKQLNGKGKIGIIFHDANFFVTNQRRQGFENTIKTKYPGIEIVATGGFTDPNKVDSVASAMLTQYPDLNGIWANWDVPAEAVLSAARTAKKSGLVITTCDLGLNVAIDMAQNGMIKGLGAQLPYDQGVAEATLAAYSLLGKQAPDYVAVPALAVTRDNLVDSYKKVYHTDPPATITDALKK